MAQGPFESRLLASKRQSARVIAEHARIEEFLDPRFANAVTNRNLVFVVGTGFSAHTSNGAEHSTWRGLLESGIQLARTLGASSEWSDLMHSNLEFGFSENDLEPAIAAASQIAKAIKSSGSYVYAKWLQGTVGSLAVERSDLGDAIRSLPYPVLTTNYDTLLEDDRRSSITWMDSRGIQEILSGTSAAIGHLHGVWTDPSSVILSTDDYSALLASSSAQELQRAVSSLKSIIYVGFGSGLEDPNFSRLIEWHRSTFLPSAVDHFRLCRASEVEELTARHTNDHIRPISYGDTFGELPQFIAGLAPGERILLSAAGIARDIVGELQQSFADEMKADAIIADTVDDLESRSLSDLVLPPVLLPVPHAEYLRSQKSGDEKGGIKRLDSFEEVRSADVVIVAAEENSGLTTAVKWLALEASRYLGAAAPLYVQFQRCRRGPKPLTEQIRAQALVCGLLEQKRAKLPPFVLALDDLSPYVEKLSDRVIEELAASDSIFTVIGCRQGMEEELVDRLARLGVKASVRYIGKLTSDDVRAYARLALPSNYDRLTDQVLSIIQSENLPRTPFTVALLISVIVQGGVLSKNASQTTILDDYVGLMLGRGDPHDDARFGLDQVEREAILSGLAQAFVEADAGGMLEADAVSAIQDVLDRFGWPESPSEVLTGLLERRVLRRDGRHVVFARSSFLHLFAAKRATADGRFREFLLREPIRYSPALTDYAALFRRDADLLRRVSNLLSATDWGNPKGSVFEEISKAEPVLIERSQIGAQASASRDTAEIELFDTTDDVDRPPFPTTNEDDLPQGVALLRVLDLVSTVLRDSDQVEDLPLKQEVLLTSLTHWGIAMSAINTDRSFREFLRLLLERAHQDSIEDPSEEFLDELTKTIPAAMFMAGIGYTLASRKLTIVLKRAVDDGTALASEEAAISAAFFLFTLRESGWIDQLKTIVGAQKNLWIFRNFLLYLLLETHRSGDLSDADREAIAHLCADIVAKSTSYSSGQEEKLHRRQLLESFDKERLMAKLKSKSDSGQPAALDG